MREIFAVVGGLTALVSILPYTVDVVRQKTKPNVVSWITWTLINFIGAAAAFAGGESRTALLTFGDGIGTLLVVLLGIRFGIAKFSRFDGYCQALALVGLGLWIALDSPLMAIALAIAVDFIALLPTLRHSWQKPGEETWQAFMLGVAASVFTLASLISYSAVSLSYPIYLLFANGAVVFAVVYKRKKLGMRLSRKSTHSTLHE